MKEDAAAVLHCHVIFLADLVPNLSNHHYPVLTLILNMVSTPNYRYFVHKLVFQAKPTNKNFQ